MTVGTGRGAREVRKLALMSYAGAMAAFFVALPGESHLSAQVAGPFSGPTLLILLGLAAAYVSRKGRREVTLHVILTLLVLAGYNATVLTPEQVLLATAGATGLLLYGELAHMRLKFERLQDKIHSKVVRSAGRSRGVLDLDEVEARVAAGLRQPLASALVLVGVGLYAARPLYGTLSPAVGASLELRSLYGALLGAGSVLVLLVLARLLGIRVRVIGRLLNRTA